MKCAFLGFLQACAWRNASLRAAHGNILKSQTLSGSQSFAQHLWQKSEKSVHNTVHKVHLKTVTSKKPTKTPPQLYRGESAHIYHLTRVNWIFWHSNIDIRILRGWLHYFMMFWEKYFFSDFHPIPTIRKWKNRFFRLAYLDQFLRYEVYFFSVD